MNQFKIDEETILIGHSCGAGFFLKYLSSKQKDFNHLFLVAPWIDPRNTLGNYFFDGVFDKRIEEKKMTIFYSLDDMADVITSVGEIGKHYVDVKSFIFKDKGHFDFGSLGTVEFKELLDEVLKIK